MYSGDRNYSLSFTSMITDWENTNFPQAKILILFLTKFYSFCIILYIAKSKPYYYRIQIGNPEVIQVGKLAMLHINN